MNKIYAGLEYPDHLTENQSMSFYRKILNGPYLPENQNKSAYAWLCMLLFFGLKYVNRAPGPLEIILAVLSILAFVVLYFTNFWIKGRASMVIVLLICALGMVWAPFNPGASVFVIFSAASCASIQPIRWAYAFLGLIQVAVVIEVVLLKLSPDFWVPSFIVSVAIGIATIMQTTLRRSQEKLVRSKEEVAHLATIAERERISRDLHDLLGHTLSLITIKAELAGKLIGRDLAACQEEISDIEKTARNALSEVRAAVTGYRQIGFTHELANAASCLSAVDISLTTQIDALKLSATAENILSLGLREAITNVARHSRATHCDIQLAIEGNWIVLKINDNGTRLTAASEVSAGNGLTGMRERVSDIGGQVILEIKQGLCLQIQLPRNHITQQGAPA